MDIKEVLTRTDGRISRSEFWLKGQLPLSAISIIAFAILIIAYEIDSIIGAAGVLFIIVYLCCLYFGVVVGIKRFHDRAKSGWWILISLVPIIGGLWYLIECGFLKGTEGQNEYGPDPTV